MAFKFVLIAALLSVANAGIISPYTYASAPVVAKIASPAHDAVASTQENVVRSFAGTVSQYSKAIDTPYSSIRKQDTRINNNIYSPALAKTVTYAHEEPIVHKTVYTAPAPAAAVYTHASPVYAHHEPAPSAALYTHAAPATLTKTISYAAPAPVYHHHEQAPAQVYQHQVPAHVSSTYSHIPAAATYSHNAPGLSAYGSSQTVHYSPAEMVSHMSFDGFGTHWGF